MPILIVDQEMYWQKPSQHGATKSPHTPNENRIPMSQRVIHPTKRTPASSSFANFEDQQTSRMERSIFRYSGHNSERPQTQHSAKQMPVLIVDQEMYWQKPSQHGATKSPHTPNENRIPMSQRVIHPTKRTPASSSFANFEDQQTSRMERSIFATLVIIQSDHRQHSAKQPGKEIGCIPNLQQMPVLIVDQEMYWQKPSRHGATKSPHTPSQLITCEF